MNKNSAHYDEDYYSGNGQDGDRPALKLFARLARRFLPPGRLLDFGCGPGFFLMHLRRHFQAVGVEHSHWAGDSARARTGLPIHSSMAPMADASLDALVSLHVVEHIEDSRLTGVLGEWRRVLRPSGRALVVTPDARGFAHRKKGDAWIAFTDPTHINLKGHAEWEAVFAEAGFKVVYRFADGLWDFPYVYPKLGKFEVFLLGWPTLLQFVLARPVLSPGSGESIIFVLERTGGG